VGTSPPPRRNSSAHFKKNPWKTAPHSSASDCCKRKSIQPCITPDSV